MHPRILAGSRAASGQFRQDLAIDFCEDVSPLGRDAPTIAHIMEEAGMTEPINAIHIHDADDGRSTLPTLACFPLLASMVKTLGISSVPAHAPHGMTRQICGTDAGVAALPRTQPFPA